MMTNTDAKKIWVIKNSNLLVQRNSFIDSCSKKFIILFVSISCNFKLHFVIQHHFNSLEFGR